jgi:predicted enzyme related to lactoylglutathione lyase
MNRHEKINYVEFPARDLEKTKRFFGEVFGWNFADYGAEYIAFSDQGLDGGFYLSEKFSSTDEGAALVVFYSERLEETLGKIVAAGGEIVRPIFAFPGGRRFHFSDPNRNEFAVWSDPVE